MECNDVAEKALKGQTDEQVITKYIIQDGKVLPVKEKLDTESILNRIEKNKENLNG